MPESCTGRAGARGSRPARPPSATEPWWWPDDSGTGRRIVHFGGRSGDRGSGHEGIHPPTDLHRTYLRWAATQHDWSPDECRREDGRPAREEWLYARRAPARPCLIGLADGMMGTLTHPEETGSEAAARSASFGLLIVWEPQLVMQLAVECAAQTRGHPTAHLSAGTYALIVHGLAHGESLDAAVQRSLQLLADWPGQQPVTDALNSPVLTSNDCPVIARARSEAGNTAASATSESVASSGSAIREVSRSSTSASGTPLVCAENWTYASTGRPHIHPGSTVFTRIRCGPNSLAGEYIALVRARAGSHR